MPDESERFTAGDLRRHLAAFPDEYEVDFSGLTFYRTKMRGPDLVQIEFAEIILWQDDQNATVQGLHPARK
jgi:hypothetical protein